MANEYKDQPGKLPQWAEPLFESIGSEEAFKEALALCCANPPDRDSQEFSTVQEVRAQYQCGDADGLALRARVAAAVWSACRHGVPALKPHEIWLSLRQALREEIERAVGALPRIPDMVHVYYLRTGCVPLLSPRIRLSEGKVRISYYRNPEDFLRSRRTLTTPERYIRAVADVTEDEARLFGMEVRVNFGPQPEMELRFARTLADIQRVYKEGPNSCMGGKVFYAGARMFLQCPKVQGKEVRIPVEVNHPAAVYASPSFAVAYIEHAGEIIARAVVNRENKTYARCYGKMKTLTDLLTAAGYTHDQCAPMGGSVLDIRSECGARALPYIDAAKQRYGGEEYGAMWNLGVASKCTARWVVDTPDGMEWATPSTPGAFQVCVRAVPELEYDCDEDGYDSDALDELLYCNYETGLVHGDRIREPEAEEEPVAQRRSVLDVTAPILNAVEQGELEVRLFSATSEDPTVTTMNADWLRHTLTVSRTVGGAV